MRLFANQKGLPLAATALGPLQGDPLADQGGEIQLPLAATALGPLQGIQVDLDALGLTTSTCRYSTRAIAGHLWLSVEQPGNLFHLPLQH